MKNQLFRYFLILFGAVLLLTGFYLFMNEWVDGKLMAFNMIVSCIIYVANIVVYPILYTSSEEFSSHIAGLGISMFFAFIYTLLGIIGIIVGIYFSVSLEWQILYQGSFLFVYLLGIYMANIANNKMNNN